MRPILGSTPGLGVFLPIAPGAAVRAGYRHPVNLLESDQQSNKYHALNPQGLVPMLEIDGLKLTQSLAIIVYLDQRHPEPPTMPADPASHSSAMRMSRSSASNSISRENIVIVEFSGKP